MDGFVINIVKVKKKDYIFHRAMLRGIKLDSSSTINNVTITLFSKFKTMTAKHRFQLSRRVLESIILRYIKNASYDDIINKYNFQTLQYELYDFLINNDEVNFDMIILDSER